MLVGDRSMGQPISEIIKEFNIHRATVSRLCRECIISGIASHHGLRSGRPRLLNGRDQRRVRRVVSVNRQATLCEITAIVNVGRTRDVSVRPVQQNLAVMAYGSRRSTLVPLLTRRHRLQRPCWAREHIGWTLDDCENVAWSDESQFQFLRADSWVRV
ncbi:hypothetical protein AVEN_115048-1 [Araneus ventricosus]|uniref:Transposase Tc1-like domain-containing protein n=1 Tax=Araneus ventricosus TaxID=182803 RepID=A0A4Y1ZXM0_ARAVE|nr:hypothetical protein AVEN_115048-1 [Araneus ventricosus]